MHTTPATNDFDAVHDHDLLALSGDLLDDHLTFPESVEEVFYPGEIEARNEARHLRDGLDLPEKSLRDLEGAAAKLGLAAPAGW